MGSNATFIVKCSQCNGLPKYTCPKCNVKTCSVKCVKLHKDTQKCDGARPKASFVTIRGYSTFNDDVSIRDQEFLHTIKSNVLDQRLLLNGNRTSGSKVVPSLNSIVIASNGEVRPKQNFNGGGKLYANNNQPNNYNQENKSHYNYSFNHNGGFHPYNNQRRNFQHVSNYRNGENNQGDRNNFRNNGFNRCYNKKRGRGLSTNNNVDDMERCLEDPNFGQN